MYTIIAFYLKDFVDSLMETRKKSLEYCLFPGFRHGELIELPGQLESPPILHRVTKAQDFNVSTELVIVLQLAGFQGPVFVVPHRFR